MGRILSEGEFVQQFTDFEHTAWKLEVRDRYDVAEEVETIQRFLRTGELGREEDHVHTSSWHRNVKATVREGKTWRRVRVVSEPLSDYITWEHAVTCFNIEAGEDIRWLPRSHPAVSELPELDFWLFDDRWVCLLHFDEKDVPHKIERLDTPDEVARYRHWRDIAWRNAITHSEFAPEGRAGFNI